MHLRLKLAAIFIGTPLALAARPLDAAWMFYLGLALLITALALPARPGQMLKERLAEVIRHLPMVGWRSRRD